MQSNMLQRLPLHCLWGIPLWRLLIAVASMFLSAVFFVYWVNFIRFYVLILPTFIFLGSSQALIAFAAYQLGANAQPAPDARMPSLQRYRKQLVLSVYVTLVFILVLEVGWVLTYFT